MQCAGCDVGLQIQMIYGPSSHKVYNVEEHVVYRNKWHSVHASTGGAVWEEKCRSTHGCGFNANDAKVGKKHPGRGPEPPLNTNCVQHCAGHWACVTSPSS